MFHAFSARVPRPLVRVMVPAAVARPTAPRTQLLATTVRRAAFSGLAGAVGSAATASGGMAMAQAEREPHLPSLAELQADPAAALQLAAADFGPGISFGSVCGFTSGFCAKKAGKLAVVMVGGVFIGLQGLASTGVIQINWDKLAELFNSAADIDGDGKVDQRDAAAAIEQLQKRLSHNMGPAGGGFGAGFLLGLRAG